jgi:SAM-dependent methyltransferase
MFAWFMARYGHKTDEYLAPYKAKLFSGLSGTVLEIGPGAGANLRHMPAKSIRWIGVEPNRYMSRHLRREAHRVGINIDLRLGTAERLPIESGSVDFVVSTLVLCSVMDQREAIREILRVLKPGGRLLFIEHVAASPGTMLRRIQTAVKPLWRRLGEGCHPDRQTRDLLEECGFAALEIEEFNAPLPIVSPHIAGSATKT